MLNQALIVAVIPSLLVAIATYIAYMRSIQFSVQSKFYEQRLNEFYFPVFLKLEKQLYKTISLSEAIEISQYLSTMIKKNSFLVNDRIIDRLEQMQKAIDLDQDHNDSFKSICSHIDNDLDYLQTKLDLPRRGFVYRLNHGQLTTSTFCSLKVFAEFFILFVIPIFVLLASYLLFIEIVK